MYKMIQRLGMPKPNILLIIMDAASASHFSCYGYEKNTTPNIDKIGKEGYIYKNAIANSLFTLPTHASLCTGDYPHEHKVLSFWHDSMENKLVKNLQKRQYKTIALPVIDHGFQEGFEEFETNPFCKRYRLFNGGTPINKIKEECSKTEFIKKIKEYFCYLRSIRKVGLKRWLNVLYRVYKKKIKDKILLEWDDFGTAKRIKRIKKEFRKKSNRPLFIYMNSVEAHYPYLPHKYREEFFPPGTTRKEVRDVVDLSYLERTLSRRELSKRRKKILTALYDAEIKYLDEQIGILYKFLRENDYLKNTILILTADHGEVIGKEGVYGHRAEMFDEILKIPMIIKYPQQQFRRKKEKKYVELKDLYTHILKISKSNITPMNGKSHAFAEYYGLDTQHKDLFRNYEISAKFWGRYQAAYYEKGNKLVWDSLGNMRGEKKLKKRIKALIGSPQKQYEIYRKNIKKKIRKRVGKIRKEITEVNTEIP